MIHTDAGCELRLVLDEGVLTTTVRDGGSNVVVDPSHVSQDPLAVHGRGLQLVDAFSSRWGSLLDAGGMAVWFVLEPGSKPSEHCVHPPARNCTLTSRLISAAMSPTGSSRTVRRLQDHWLWSGAVTGEEGECARDDPGPEGVTMSSNIREASPAAGAMSGRTRCPSPRWGRGADGTRPGQSQEHGHHSGARRTEGDAC